MSLRGIAAGDDPVPLHEGRDVTFVLVERGDADFRDLEQVDRRRDRIDRAFPRQFSECLALRPAGTNGDQDGLCSAPAAQVFRRF